VTRKPRHNVFKSFGVDNVDTTTLSTPEVSERVKLWREHYSRHKEVVAWFSPRLYSVRRIGRRRETNWKKTGTLVARPNRL